MNYSSHFHRTRIACNRSENEKQKTAVGGKNSVPVGVRNSRDAFFSRRTKCADVYFCRNVGGPSTADALQRRYR